MKAHQKKHMKHMLSWKELAGKGQKGNSTQQKYVQSAYITHAYAPR